MVRMPHVFSEGLTDDSGQAILAVRSSSDPLFGTWMDG
jgi:hypothetical protein